MTVIAKRVYFAGPGLSSGLLHLLSYRLQYGARLRELGLSVIDPYAPFVNQFREMPTCMLERLPREELEALLVHAIKRAGAEDPYFRLLRERISRGGLASIERKHLVEIASPAEYAEIDSLDATRLGECDVLVAYLPHLSEGISREVDRAQQRGMLRYAFGIGKDIPELDIRRFHSCYPTFDLFAPVLECFNSGEGPYLTTSPVNDVSGHVLLYGIDVAAMYPHVLAQIAGQLGRPHSIFSFCCERSHIHELAQKLPVMLRLGNINIVSVLTKDGSPHDVQMHTLAQEVCENVGFSGELVHFTVEHGTLHRISSGAVKASRHLCDIENALSNACKDGRQQKHSATRNGKSPLVAILIGGQDDMPTVEAAGIRDLLTQAGINFTFDIVSSDREPEKLRRLCIANTKKWDAVIAIAGGIPNLPVVVKSWLPSVPVIAVPVDERPNLTMTSLTTPSRVPLIIAGYGEQGVRKSATLVTQLLQWRGRKGHHSGVNCEPCSKTALPETESTSVDGKDRSRTEPQHGLSDRSAARLNGKVGADKKRRGP
jgi:phosphoribosylcarboxyaminoimidazole (NCAIR) mutase